MRNCRLVIACLLALLLALGACQSQVAYHHFRHISSPGWDKSDTLHFDVQPMTEDGNYEVLAELRTDKNYPFQNSKEGVIEGDGISAFQYQFHVRYLNLHKGDSLHICVAHNMKREIMPGIIDVGVLIANKVAPGVDSQKDKK